MEDKKYKYLFKNTLLFTVSSFGSKILTFLLVPLYTNVLSTAEYGTADLISTTSTLLFYFFTLNIADSVLRFAIDREQNKKEILAYGLKVTFIGSLICALGCAALPFTKLLNWNGYCYAFLFLRFFFYSLNNVVINYLRAADKIKEVAIAGLITTAVTIASNILCLLWFKLGLLGYLISVVSGAAVSTLYGWIVICRDKNNGSVLKCCDKQVRREMRDYSVPLIFNGVCWWANNSLDKYFLLGMIGESANGIYGVAQKIPTILTVFQSIFNQAWNLSAIREFDKDDSDGFFSGMYNIYNAGMVLVCSGLILFNIPLARLLFAKDFFEAWKCSSILLLSVLFSSLAGFVGSVFTAVKNSRIFAVSTVTAAAVNAVLNYFLIKAFGVTGAAAATAVSFVIVWLIRLICSRKYIRLRIKYVRDIAAYLLLVGQIVAEHMENHNYPIQILIFVVLVALYGKEFIEILKKIKALVAGKVKRK